MTEICFNKDIKDSFVKVLIATKEENINYGITGNIIDRSTFNKLKTLLNREDEENDDSYIGAVKYVNNNLLPAVKRIIEEDPEAVIVVCSDHGNRFGILSLKYVNRILNMLYYGGEKTTSFEGLSSVNTLRFILNREFGLEMEYLELPSKKGVK